MILLEELLLRIIIQLVGTLDYALTFLKHQSHSQGGIEKAC